MISNIWKKASKSNPSGNCVEAMAVWIKAAASNGNGGANCVEVACVAASASAAAGHCVEVGFATAEKSAAQHNCVEVGFATAEKSASRQLCVEVGFAKAEKSISHNACVEISTATKHMEGGCGCDTIKVGGVPISGAKQGDVLVRDSKDKGEGPIIVFKPEVWSAFLDEVRKLGMGWQAQTKFFDGDGENMYVIVDPASDVESLQRGRMTDVKALYYTEDEWDAFVDGVRKNEFNLPAVANV